MPPPDAPPVVTFGYEGRSVAEVFALLREHGARVLVDVRENPWSRRPEFGRDGLRAEAEARGLRYVHLPGLGCRHAAREAFRRGGSWEVYRADYLARLAEAPGAVAELEALAAREPVAVLCTERRVRECHRLVLGERLEADGFRVVHL